MRVLFVASEVAPYSKTGGLGDVGAALPAALAARGIRVRVVTPLYASVDRRGLERTGQSVRVRFAFGEERARLWKARRSARHDVLFLEHEGYFGRPGIYGERAKDYPDNHRRFGLLSVGALAAAEATGWTPDVVHLNDWQTGLAAVASPFPCLFTIHNLAYQGRAPPAAARELGLELPGPLNQLELGIAFSDVLTTVSPTYAKEICTPEGGWGLDSLLRRRADRLHGILNGVDYQEWDSTRDPALPAHYGPGQLAGKERCKRALLERFRFPASTAERPLFGLVSRLASQKGIELIVKALPRLVDAPWSFVAAGTGEPALERGLRALERAHPDRVRVHLGFDEPLAHQIEAGSDFFLMPSRYEPCGLNQMYSLRYGTVPIVRATGGLDDTVLDASHPKGTGLKFDAFAPAALADAVRRALALYRDPRAMAGLRRRGMKADFSWARAAERYERLYRRLA